MRKILMSLFLINILLSFFIIYDLENNRLNERISNSGEEENYTILIDKGINELERNTAIDKIQEIAKKHEAGLLFRVYNNAPGQKLKLSKFVYLKDSDELQKDIRVKGDFIGNYDRSLKYLDTGKIKNGHQVGSILVLDPQIYYRISTFESLKNSKYTLSGFYSVKIDECRLAEFVSDLQDELGVNVSLEKNFNNMRLFIPAILKIIPMIIVFLLTVLIVIFDLISRFKDIGVKKLNGYSDNCLKLEYYRGIGRLYLISTIISYSFLGILFIKFRNILYVELVLKSLLSTGLFFLVICLLVLISLCFISRIKMSDAIKNKKPVHIIKNFCYGIKILFTVILIGLFILGLKLYMPVHSFYFENLKKWEDTINYAQVSAGYEERNESFEDIVWNMVQNKKLYVYANKMGGLQILVNEKFDGERYGEKQSYLEKIIWKSIEINTNYLNKHPVYDLNKKRITVDDNENTNYILIPEKYKDLQEEIIYNLEDRYYSIHDAPIEFKEGRKKEQKLAHELAPEYFAEDFGRFKAIIIENGQEYFTYDIFKYPETNNMVKDRVVIVNNNKAGLGFDISNNGGYLIKVNNPGQPFLSIRDKVEELGLLSTYQHAYSIYGSIASEITNYLEILSQIAVMFLMAGITIAILIACSIIIYMEREKMDLSVKFFNGYGFFERHGRKLLETMTLYVIFLPAFYFVRGNVKEITAVGLLLVGIMMLDLLISIIFINLYEKRNIKDILKGN